MLTTIEGHYANGKVELQETPHGIERARVIVTFFPEASGIDKAGQGVDLFGVWKDRVPANVDIDELLRDIRIEWTQDLEGVNG